MINEGAILIIEDDTDDQEVLREVLHELKVKNQILFFNDCERAFEHLISCKVKPFLIVCDINLPKMDGIELKQKIDATESLRKMAIPFVFLTTSDSEQTINRAYSITNLQGYFQKSHTFADIRAKVKTILDYWYAALHSTIPERS
jgi:CheY-like chemotaxis protein